MRKKYFFFLLLLFFTQFIRAQEDPKYRLVNEKHRVYIEKTDKNTLRVIVFQKELYDAYSSYSNEFISAKNKGAENILDFKIVRDKKGVIDAKIKYNVDYKSTINAYFNINLEEIPTL